MVGVTEGVIDDIPGRFVLKVFFVDENPQQFDNSQSWMGVIKLDTDFLAEVFPLKLFACFFGVTFVSPDDVLQGG